MAIIPLNQEITHFPSSSVSDGWGSTEKLDPVVLKARVETTSEVVRNPSGKEVVANLKIYLDGFPNITYDDDVQYVDENGYSVKRKPSSIDVKRMLGGNPVMTILFV